MYCIDNENTITDRLPEELTKDLRDIVYRCTNCREHFMKHNNNLIYVFDEVCHFHSDDRKLYPCDSGIYNENREYNFVHIVAPFYRGLAIQMKEGEETIIPETVSIPGGKIS